jgi:hypothetical protein
MNERLVLVAIFNLTVTVALLHSSLGQPFLQVSHNLDVAGEVLLECLDAESGLAQSRATYTFKDPEGGAESRFAEDNRYVATILRTNESLVTCTLENMPGESQPVKVVGTSSINRYYK